MERGSNRTIETTESCGQNTGQISVSQIPGRFATGFYGRTGNHLDSFGLITSSIQLFDKDLDVLVESVLREENLYANGGGGADFGDVRCEEGKVLTGIKFRSGDYVDGIKSYNCSEIIVR